MQILKVLQKFNTSLNSIIFLSKFLELFQSIEAQTPISQ